MEQLKKIVKQLKDCKYECQWWPLENNIYFQELEKMSTKNIIWARQIQDEFRQYIKDMEADWNVFSWEEWKPSTISEYIEYNNYYVIN